MVAEEEHDTTYCISRHNHLKNKRSKTSQKRSETFNNVKKRTENERKEVKKKRFIETV